MPSAPTEFEDMVEIIEAISASLVSRKKMQPNTISQIPRRTKNQQIWIGLERCTIHFSPDTKVSDMYLKKDAVPSLYIPSQTDTDQEVIGHAKARAPTVVKAFAARIRRNPILKQKIMARMKSKYLLEGCPALLTKTWVLVLTGEPWDSNRRQLYLTSEGPIKSVRSAIPNIYEMECVDKSSLLLT
ncbi:hypothetical protein Trydic_g14527 [Trypoxylus dichotomus]